MSTVTSGQLAMERIGARGLKDAFRVVQLDHLKLVLPNPPRSIEEVRAGLAAVSTLASYIGGPHAFEIAEHASTLLAGLPRARLTSVA